MSDTEGEPLTLFNLAEAYRDGFRDGLAIGDERTNRFRLRFRNAERRITAARKWLRLGQVHKAMTALARYPK